MPRRARRTHHKRTERQAGVLAVAAGLVIIVILGAGPPAQPLRIGPGVIRAGLHATRQDRGEHERGGGLEFAAEQAGGPVASEVIVASMQVSPEL